MAIRNRRTTPALDKYHRLLQLAAKAEHEAEEAIRLADDPTLISQLQERAASCRDTAKRAKAEKRDDQKK